MHRTGRTRTRRGPGSADADVHRRPPPRLVLQPGVLTVRSVPHGSGPARPQEVIAVRDSDPPSRGRAARQPAEPRLSRSSLTRSRSPSPPHRLPCPSGRRSPVAVLRAATVTTGCAGPTACVSRPPRDRQSPPESHVHEPLRRPPELHPRRRLGGRRVRAGRRRSLTHHRPARPPGRSSTGPLDHPARVTTTLPGSRQAGRPEQAQRRRRSASSSATPAYHWVISRGSVRWPIELPMSW